MSFLFLKNLYFKYIPIFFLNQLTIIKNLFLTNFKYCTYRYSTYILLLY